MLTLVSIALTALCFLLCRELEIPSYAKPIKLDIKEVIIPLFSFLNLGTFGKISKISFVKMLCVVGLKEEVCSQ